MIDTLPGMDQDTAYRILTGKACPAVKTSGRTHVCGAEPAGNDFSGRFIKHPHSVSAFCAYHLGKLHEWAGWVSDFDEERKAEIIAEHEKKKAAEMKARSVVYFVRIPGARIKIGTTSKLRTRLGVHRRAYGDAELLLTLSGRHDAERAAHRRFAPYLVDGEREVFHAAPEVLEWIASNQP